MNFSSAEYVEGIGYTIRITERYNSYRVDDEESIWKPIKPLLGLYPQLSHLDHCGVLINWTDPVKIDGVIHYRTYIASHLLFATKDQAAIFKLSMNVTVEDDRRAIESGR